MCSRRWVLSSLKKKSTWILKTGGRLSCLSDWKVLSTLDFQILNFEKLSPFQFLISFLLTYCLFFSFRKIFVTCDDSDL